MKKMILGLSLLLMLVQNGFARTDAEFDALINKQPTEVWKYTVRCSKEAMNHPNTGNLNYCLKAIALNEQFPYQLKKQNIINNFQNAGLLYYSSERNYVKAYEYTMKAAKLGSIYAQHNLDNMCREHSWVCR